MLRRRISCAWRRKLWVYTAGCCTCRCIRTNSLSERKTSACWRSLSNAWPTMALMFVVRSVRTGCMPAGWGSRASASIFRALVPVSFSPESVERISTLTLIGAAMVCVFALIERSIGIFCFCLSSRKSQRVRMPSVWSRLRVSASVVEISLERYRVCQRSDPPCTA